MTKAELRKTYLARQRQLAHADHLEKSRRIAERFFQAFDLTGVRLLHCFLPIEKKREVDTWRIFQTIWRDFTQIATVVSRVDFELMTLENIRFTAGDKLIFNRWHILEPERKAGETRVEAARIDAVLIPLLAYDARGYRVGYGKGFYDKFLSDCRPDALKIGLSYFAPVAEICDIETFDVRLDFCVTPDEVFKF